MPTRLRLEVTEYTDETRWRWALKDTTGAVLADHQVHLDPSDGQFDAFRDLQDYVSWHYSAPDKRLAEEARIVTWLGDWIGAEVLGPRIGGTLLQHAPAIVEVILPAGAETIAYRPLEVARFHGRSLAGHDVMLVIQPPAANGAASKTSKTTDRLRVLGLFSLPEGGTALNLRRERQSLVSLISDIAKSGRAVEVKALQYGVTQDRLRDILNDGEGWDIIHISGHGVPGELVLETADGRPDHVAAAGLADLLEASRDRVKLVTVSACWSAALATAEPRRQLGLPAHEGPSQHRPERNSDPPPSPIPGPGDIATTLAARLDCAVLAMRFPVGDEFAIELAAKLYGLLVGEGQPLPRAAALALRQFTHSGQALRFSALSMAAPAIFGTAATDLTLKAPEHARPVSSAAENPKMAGFRPQPDRFVGRTAVMARSSAALAPDSGVPGVVLHGMPGGGKTACALELAYTHEDAFDSLVWFKAPDEDLETNGALADFALTLQRYVGGLQMAHLVNDAGKVASFLPELTTLMEQNRILIVLDNAESLLGDDGHWNDERWGQVVGALTSHRGPGRLILTSRRLPADIVPVQVENVDALSLDEGLLLARELPNLRRLMLGTPTGMRRDTARKLATSVLKVAQGHPTLLELADGQAANPGQLIDLLRAGTRAWTDHGGLPDGFFTTGESSAGSGDYMSVLATWTATITDALPAGARYLFWLLCCLEESDRERALTGTIWPPLWKGTSLWRGIDHDTEPPSFEEALASLTAHALVTPREIRDGRNTAYTIHPGVAAEGRDHAGDEFYEGVSTLAAGYWGIIYQQSRRDPGDAGIDTQLVVHAGLALAPYFVRLRQWAAAGAALHNAFIRNPSRATATAVLPAIQIIARHDPLQAYTLATVLKVLDPAAAERQFYDFIDTAVAAGKYKEASEAAVHLVGLCLDSGQLGTALTLSWQQADYVRQAELGPWAQLQSEILNLRVVSEMGHASSVLDNARRLLKHVNTLPAGPDPDRHDGISPWMMREALLDIGHSAAVQLGRWRDAIDLNGELVASMHERCAPAAVAARARANDVGPLLRLDRADDAFSLLLECREVFLDVRDFQALGSTLDTLAHIENRRGHYDEAIRLERESLRYAYLVGNAADAATRYHNLGFHLRQSNRQPALALSSHLAAGLIRGLAGLEGPGDSAGETAEYLRAFGTAARAPADIAELCRQIGDIPGTDPVALINRLAPDPVTAEWILQFLIAQARPLAETPSGDTDSK